MKDKNSRTKSELFFHSQPENLNCAQAILRGFQKELNITNQEIEEYRAWGGERIQGGICGALYSAERLLSQVGKPGITEEFKAKTGKIHCFEIKAIKFPCIDCVRLADQLIEKRME